MSEQETKAGTVHVEVLHDDHQIGHGTLSSYITGFVLAAILTAAAFWLVMADVLPTRTATVLALTALAVVQIIVHMVYFLHMNLRSEGGWTIMALIFTLILVVIALTGSLWIMYHLNANMMPEMPHDMRTMP